MNLLNVIKIGMGSLACTSLLMACADGRGTNGFKARQFTAEERKANKEKLDAMKPAPAPADTGAIDDTTPPGGETPDAPVEPGGEPATEQPVAPSTPAPGTDQGAPLFTDMDDTAKGKLFGEQRLPTEPEQQVAAKVNDLNVTIEHELKSGENKAATNLIKGITVIPSGNDSQRLLAIQAIVSIGGEDLYFDASDVPVKFHNEGEQIPNILFRLNKPCDQGVVAAKNSLWAAVKCRDQACTVIEVVLSFEVAGGRANGVVVIKPGQNAQGQAEWQIQESNIGRPKTFIEAQAAGPACQGPAQTEPAKTEPAAAAPVTPAPAAAKPAPSAEQVAADQKRCDALKAEGFNCQDSPVEINRMRAARAAAKKAAADKRCEALKKEGFDCNDGDTEINRMRAARAAAAKAAPAATKPVVAKPALSAEQAAAEQKRCDALKAEGFSCQDSPSEINRMRAARAAAKKAAADKRCEALKKEGFDCNDGDTEINRMRAARAAAAKAAAAKTAPRAGGPR